MVDLIKKFVKITGDFFDFSKERKPSKSTQKKIDDLPVYKTRTQLIAEGKGAYLPKRHRHTAPVVNKIYL